VPIHFLILIFVTLYMLKQAFVPEWP